jgi:hypothetical protein
MLNLRKLSQSINQIDFETPSDKFDSYYQNFLNSDLGHLYQSIPWKSLTKSFSKKLKRKHTGRLSIFDLQGKLALMFLKSYTGSSDRKLVERLNSDYHFQFFCGLYLHPDQQLKDYKIVSHIRCELGKLLDIEDFQKQLMNHWKPYMNQLGIFLTDATCYQTSMRYPTNVKLLWEACDWIYRQMQKVNKARKGRMPRSKYGEQKSKYLSYQKSRKKTHKLTQRRIKSLLYLLDKLLEQFDTMLKELPPEVKLPYVIWNRKDIIENVLEQQYQWYTTGEKPKDLIVSIDKSYIRPIVRGKETKRVEFGAKVNTIQMDGINFIERLSFDAFHEGIRLQSSIYLAQSLTHTKTKAVAADNIYATNANRNYCSKEKIQTNFIPKGKPSKDAKQQKQLRQILSKERATRMEGSFGTEKQHYSLDKIKARIEKTEILWICFGIHTANAVRIAKRIKLAKESPPNIQPAA